VFDVQSDGFDHEIEFVGAVDFSGNAVIFADVMIRDLVKSYSR
jgi:hypothetical protein